MATNSTKLLMMVMMINLVIGMATNIYQDPTNPSVTNSNTLTNIIGEQHNATQIVKDSKGSVIPAQLQSEWTGYDAIKIIGVIMGVFFTGFVTLPWTLNTFANDPVMDIVAFGGTLLFGLMWIMIIYKGVLFLRKQNEP